MPEIERVENFELESDVKHLMNKLSRAQQFGCRYDDPVSEALGQLRTDLTRAARLVDIATEEHLMRDAAARYSMAEARVVELREQL